MTQFKLSKMQDFIRGPRHAAHLLLESKKTKGESMERPMGVAVLPNGHFAEIMLNGSKQIVAIVTTEHQDKSGDLFLISYCTEISTDSAVDSFLLLKNMSPIDLGGFSDYIGRHENLRLYEEIESEFQWVDPLLAINCVEWMKLNPRQHINGSLAKIAMSAVKGKESMLKASRDKDRNDLYEIVGKI